MLLISLLMLIQPAVKTDTFTTRGNAYQILAAYCKQLNTTVIADGGFSGAVYDVSVSGSKEEILSKVAERMDCSVQITKSGIPVLMRRFRRDGEFPQADKELVQAAREIVAAFSILKYAIPDPGHDVWSMTLRQLASSFTPLQKTALKEGRALVLSQLDAEQRRQFEMAIQVRAYGGLRYHMMLTGKQLEYVQSGRLRTLPSKRLPSVYDCRLIQSGPGFSSDETIATFPGPNGQLDIEAPDIIRVSLTPAGTAPAPTGEGLSALVNLTAGTRTIGELFDGLVAQAGAKIKVAEALRERKTFAAISGARFADILDAITQLYGWRWQQKEDGEILLERQSRRLPQTASEISQYVRSVLPPDIRRYFGIPSGDEKAPFEIDPYLRDRALADAATRRLWKTWPITIDSGPTSRLPTSVSKSRKPSDCFSSRALWIRGMIVLSGEVNSASMRWTRQMRPSPCRETS